MISHGDEMGRTQQGNNNAYCQDNEITWIDWDLTDEQQQLLEFTARLVALPARAAGAAPPQVFSGPRHSRRRRQGPGLARARTAAR